MEILTGTQIAQFLETRTGRILFRAGIVLAVILLFLLIAYLAASVKPGFYRRFESVPHAERKKLNDEFLSHVLTAYSQVQESDKWSLGFTDGQFNGWLAVDGSSKMFRVLPSEIKSPRLAVRGDRIEIAAPVSYRSFSATVILSGTISVPEPGVIAIRFRSARLGVYPFDKEKLVAMVKGSLDQPGWELEQTNEGGDPVLSFRPNITIDNKFALTVESFQTDDTGQCRITGTVAKVKR
ncbi:MAG: hypothetical protein FWD31_00370 [Planctomycetaceae bacterium]|nr:hypothetical protein [Planctomycetaceae bacterium]